VKGCKKVRHCNQDQQFDGWQKTKSHLFTLIRVNRWVLKKITQNAAQPVFVKIYT
jgi:hypothetical protein